MTERQQVREKLEALHAALREAGAADPESRELLRTVLADIQRLLDREAEHEPESLVDRLREAMEEFEESHPTLTEAAGRVIDALAKMGI
jgi:type VI protein secretion system component VasF